MLGNYNYQTSVNISKDDRKKEHSQTSLFKENGDGTIYYEKTEITTVMSHKMAKPSLNQKILPYKVVNIFTKNGLKMEALQLLDGDGFLLHLNQNDEDKTLFSGLELLLNVEASNYSFNCHGQSFLGGNFWLNFTTENMNKFLKHEKIDYATDESHIDNNCCLLYTSPSPRDKRQSRMPSSA